MRTTLESLAEFLRPYPLSADIMSYLCLQILGSIKSHLLEILMLIALPDSAL